MLLPFLLVTCCLAGMWLSPRVKGLLVGYSTTRDLSRESQHSPVDCPGTVRKAFPLLAREPLMSLNEHERGAARRGAESMSALL